MDCDCSQVSNKVVQRGMLQNRIGNQFVITTTTQSFFLNQIIMLAICSKQDGSIKILLSEVQMNVCEP